jgi:hypothetical protein
MTMKKFIKSILCAARVKTVTFEILYQLSCGLTLAFAAKALNFTLGGMLGLSSAGLFDLIVAGCICASTFICFNRLFKKERDSFSIETDGQMWARLKAQAHAIVVMLSVWLVIFVIFCIGALMTAYDVLTLNGNP